MKKRVILGVLLCLPVFARAQSTEPIIEQPRELISERQTVPPGQDIPPPVANPPATTNSNYPPVSNETYRQPDTVPSQPQTPTQTPPPVQIPPQLPTPTPTPTQPQYQPQPVPTAPPVEIAPPPQTTPPPPSPGSETSVPPAAIYAPPTYTPPPQNSGNQLPTPPPLGQTKLPAFNEQTPSPLPNQPVASSTPQTPMTPDEIQLQNFKNCVDDAHRIKLGGLWYAQQSQFENATQYFNLGRDAYNICMSIIPSDWMSYFFLPEGFRLAKKDYLMDFADLFFQFALLQQDDDNKVKDINLAIGAMQQALERLEEACNLKKDDTCQAKRQSYYTVMADSYRLNQSLDQAISYFEKANSIVPDDPANLSFWGLALFEMGLVDQAQAKWDLAIQKDPTAPAAAMQKQFKKKKKSK